MYGTSSIKDICANAKRLGYNKIAITDTNNLYGLWTFLNSCKKEGITPIIGAEIIDDKSQRAICLAATKEGYSNLCRLITKRHLDDTFDIKTSVINHYRGLLFLTNNIELILKWHEYGIMVYGVMERNPLSLSHPLCKTCNELGIPIVGAPGSYFLTVNEYNVHKMLRAIGLNRTLSLLKAEDMAANDSYLANSCEYLKRFSIYPKAVENTYKIAEKISFTGPSFGIVFPAYKDLNLKDALGYLRESAYLGAKKRYGNNLPQNVINRLEHELKIIGDMGFASYFLIVKDIVASSPRTCGRGSGAASLVAYSLFITNVCPIKHNLYFERFLNPGRIDPPDIDIDFAWDERDMVIKSVFQKFDRHCAMVANHVMFQPRMAIREVAKVYGLTESEINQVSKRMPWFWRTDELDLELISQLKNHPAFKTVDFPEPWPQILSIAQKIIGIPRYLSVHPGGIIITPDPIDSYVPLEKASKGVNIIQWEKEGTEQAGLVKIDLLGNRSLGVIRDAILNIHKNGIEFDESKWEPEDDFATQEVVSHGETMGCFYIESPAMRLLQKKTRVGDFEHLVIHSSIIRPAANDYIKEYISRLHGGLFEPIHPLLSGVLNETFGIMVYQEDVSKTAVAIAGFSHDKADNLRKILSKKDKKQILKDFYDEFAEGARLKGLKLNEIDDIWKMIMSFDGYSFCKPHSASYAKVSFQAAYLKVHFPAEFMAAVLSNQGGFYSPFAYVSEAKRLGITIVAPDVNKSYIKWTGKEKTIWVGLLSIKGLSLKTQENIILQRSKRCFSDMKDFLNRIQPDESEIRALINCGAFDCFAQDNNRARLLWDYNYWQKTKHNLPTNKMLFNENLNNCSLPSLPPDDYNDRLKKEYLVLTFLCKKHPMELFYDRLKDKNIIKAVNLSRYIGKSISIAAWLITGKLTYTKYGEPMEFLTFEDETGIFETIFFTDAYKKFSYIIHHDQPYILYGKVEEDWSAVTLNVSSLIRILSAP